VPKGREGRGVEKFCRGTGNSLTALGVRACFHVNPMVAHNYRRGWLFISLYR
jgi:hypothetical protein